MLMWQHRQPADAMSVTRLESILPHDNGKKSRVLQTASRLLSWKCVGRNARCLTLQVPP